MPGQPPLAWNRATPWRQGHVFAAATVDALGLAAVHGGETRVVVISHDCDLANDDLDVEPDVEIVIGRLVPAADGNLTWGKSPRTLHLPFRLVGQNDEAPVVELIATNKAHVPKATLARYVPDPSHVLPPEELAVLRRWLSARYDRAAFPDEFVRRMQETRFDTRLAKILAPHGVLVSFVYFDVDGGVVSERDETTSYELGVFVVYRAGAEPEVAAESADGIVEKIEAECAKRFVPLPDSTVPPIKLNVCFAISEDDLPVSRARVATPWRLEHMTLKADGDEVGPVAM